MKKKLTETGTNGTFEATIVITFNYKNEEVKGHNPSTHDDTITTVWLHKIETIYFDKIDKEVLFSSKEAIIKELPHIEKDVQKLLHILANQTKKLTVEEQLKEKGYN